MRLRRRPARPASSMRARWSLMSPSSTTRQAGESTRRVVTRTSLARSFSVAFQALEHRLEGVSAVCSACFFSSSSCSLPRSTRALATLCSGLPSNSNRCASIHSSTRSTSSSTSMPFLRKISSCGLFLAAASVIGGDVRRSPPGPPSCASRSRPATRLRRRAWTRSAAAWPGAPGWRGPRPCPPSSTAPKSGSRTRRTCRARLRPRCRPAISSIDSTRLVEPSRIAFTSRLSCSSSRLTFERQVGRVDHALHEAQVHRHQRLGVVHDEARA